MKPADGNICACSMFGGQLASLLAVALDGLEASLQACLQCPWMVWRPACKLACSGLGWFGGQLASLLAVALDGSYLMAVHDDHLSESTGIGK